MIFSLIDSGRIALSLIICTAAPCFSQTDFSALFACAHPNYSVTHWDPTFLGSTPYIVCYKHHIQIVHINDKLHTLLNSLLHKSLNYFTDLIFHLFMWSKSIMWLILTQIHTHPISTNIQFNHHRILFILHAWINLINTYSEQMLDSN